MPDVLRILGIDPSTVATGWCVLAVDGSHEGVAAGGVYTPPKGDADARLLDAFRWLRGAVEIHGPDVVAIETPFYRMNARTLVTLAQLGAAFRLAATIEGLPVEPVAPAERCTALGLAGNVDKRQVLYTVNAVYNLSLTDHNEADAVAIAAAAALRRRTETFATGG